MSAPRFCLTVAGCLTMAVSARAQVVQLPTFNFFSVSTSVSVPDRGGAYLGGVDRSSRGAQHVYLPLLPGQSAGGGGQSAQRMSVMARVHDLQGPPTVNAARRTTHADRFAQRLAAASRAQVPRAATEQRAEAARDEREALRFLELGDRARDAGKTDVARIYYEMSSRRAQANLAGVVAARLEALRALEAATAAR